MRQPLLPPTYFLASLVLIVALGFALPLGQALSGPWRLTGLLAIGLGAWLNLAADRAFRAAATTVKPFETSRVLVTEGVFRLTRNPMYLGMVAILLGVCLLIGALSPFAVCLVFALALRVRFIPVEERMLAETYGERWQAYRARTRRWL